MLYETLNDLEVAALIAISAAQREAFVKAHALPSHVVQFKEFKPCSKPSAHPSPVSSLPLQSG